jgi:N-acetylglucosaminyldiphosphoundecaprenol N-acetyl-beta-D-mannosaminyltransferase
MRTKLFDLEIDTLSFSDAIEFAMDLIEQQKASQVVTINPEMFETANHNINFRKIVDEAELIIPDGVGVKIALKINGINVDRIPGIDFAHELLIKSAKNNYPVAIIGAKEDVLSKAIKKLKNEIENLNIVYSHNGYFDNDNEIINELASKSPKLVLIAMGSPRQEEFIYKAKSTLSSGLFIGIGGSLDVWSGNLKRAPKIIQKLGLEWLYRTLSQPSRFKRIFPTLPLFIIKAIKYKFTK